MTFISRVKTTSRKLAGQTVEIGDVLKKHLDDNKERWQESASGGALSAAEVAMEAGARSVADTARNLYRNVRYSKAALQDLQHRIEAQGGRALSRA